MSQIFDALRKAEVDKGKTRTERPKTLTAAVQPVSHFGHTASHLGPGIQVKAQIFGDEDLQIYGTAQALISLQGRQLAAGRTAHVSASIVANKVMVKDEVQGHRDEGARKNPGPVCPRCGKTDTPRSRRSGIRDRLRSLLFRVFPYRCLDCDHRFFAKRKWDS